MRTVVLHFISGPKNGQAAAMSDDCYEVVIEDLPDWGSMYQSNEVVKPRQGYYTRVGNLLIWEGWGK